MSKFCQSIFILIVVTSTCFAQDEEEKYVITTLPDGTRIREVADSDITPAFQRVKLRHALKTISDPNIKFLLDSPSAIDLAILCGDEVLPTQKEELKRISNSYAAAVSKLEDKAGAEYLLLRVAHFRKIKEVLLPEQLQSILMKCKQLDSLLMTSIVASPLSQELELTDVQKEDIIRRCKAKNEEIKRTLEELKMRTDKHRKDLEAICNDVLTEKQRRM